ncbi:polycomb protein suz12-B [Anabrus simplex]|uniref:polycomb protein suz12-B n=1 Tax=Anabrus simplex TaxID=316456 RepID=UPI0035A2903D
MPPKKRDKDTETTKNSRMDPMQADHELFLQAFEKPTQIYRFLRTRNMLSPVFLNRTLSYMRQRMSRSHKHRKGFRVDCLMDRMVKKNREMQPEALGGYMTLTFLGFYDKRFETPQEPVKVETLLLKICHKKRKDVSSPFMQVSVGTSEVPINPSEDHPPPKAPTVSIPTESFSLSNGHLVKSYVLLLRVYCASANGLLANGNGDADTEPAQKRRKSSSGPLKGQTEEVKLFGSELVVYDKHNRCLLRNGDYELVLQEVTANVRSSPKKHSSWEAIGEIKEECGPFEVFSKGPTLKFRLNWTTEPSNGFVDRPTPLRPYDSLDSSSNKENCPEQTQGTKVAKKEEPRLQIVYQFLYNNNSRQQTEACEDLTCPWCSLDCVSLYALLKHLKLCHSRFTFTYVPIPQGARIDVAINECYDGSYTGSPHDLISQPPGFAFSRNGPVRRTSVSNILVCHPKRPKPSLSEFLELDENEFDGQRPYITGHNRLYHHTTTCLPIYPKEMDVDSEGEHDPKWLQTKTMMMIDDFTDVNEGEKELMKMWNLHVMKYGYVGDCQIPLACTMFLEAKGKELLMKNLYRNFVLHMCNLFDFGLVSPVTLYTTIQHLQKLISESGEVRDVLHESWRKQRETWHANGGQSLVSIQPEKTAQSADSSLRRKSTSQSMQQMNGIHQSSNKGQVHQNNSTLTEPVLRRKSSSCSSNSQQHSYKQPAPDPPSQTSHRRKSSANQQSASSQALPLNSIQQNSLKNQLNGSANATETGLVTLQRRKSATSLLGIGSQNQSNGLVSSMNLSDTTVSQPRRKSLGQQHQNQANGSVNHSDSLPPLRRKSFNQVSNADSMGKSQLENRHSGVTSLVSESSTIQHRRKSSSMLSDTNLQIHSTKNGVS